MNKLIFVLSVALSPLLLAGSETNLLTSEELLNFERILRRAEVSFPDCIAEAREKGAIEPSQYIYTPKPEEGKYSRTYKYSIVSEGEIVGTLSISGRPGIVVKNLTLKTCDVE